MRVEEECERAGGREERVSGGVVCVAGAAAATAAAAIHQANDETVASRLSFQLINSRPTAAARGGRIESRGSEPDLSRAGCPSPSRSRQRMSGGRDGHASRSLRCVASSCGVALHIRFGLAAAGLAGALAGKRKPIGDASRCAPKSRPSRALIASANESARLPAARDWPTCLNANGGAELGRASLSRSSLWPGARAI
jgi:hypothetical protein